MKQSNTKEYRDRKAVMVYMPPSLKNKVMAAAFESGRSVSGEVAFILGVYFDGKKA